MSKFLLIFASLTMLVPARSADHPNFTGEWKMNAGKSNFGPLPTPEKFTRTIVHHEPFLEITTVQGSAEHAQTVRTSLRSDGKPVLNDYATGSASSTGRWNGDAFEVETTKHGTQGGDVVTREKWTLSSDGKTMSVASHFQMPQRTFDVSLVLDKQ